MEKQILNEILTNLKTINYSVNELKDGQTILMANYAKLATIQADFAIQLNDFAKQLNDFAKQLNDFGKKQERFEERQIRFEETQNKFDVRLTKVEKDIRGLKDDMNTVHSIAIYNHNILKKHFDDVTVNFG